MVKSRKNTIILTALSAVLMGLAGLLLLWLGTVGAEVYFVMPGGRITELEYGDEFRDDTSAYLRLPLIGISIPLGFDVEGETGEALGDYTFVYSAKFLGRRHVAERTVRLVDTKPPVIELYGENGSMATWQEGYEEEGYRAWDIHDGELTDCVQREISGGCIVYTVTDASGNTERVTRELDYGDTLPRIYLAGSETLELCPLPYYKEPGYAAMDALGNDYSSQIKIEGGFEPWKVGEYELLYSLESPAGDKLMARRTVNVSLPAAESAAAEGKVIYLSFDDGPGPYTDALLALLDAYDAKATFFVTGANPRYADCIGRAYSAGHSIGVHSYTHSYGRIYASEEGFFEDFSAIQELIYRQTGTYSAICRFPGGSSNTVSRFNPGIMSRLTASLDSMGYRYFDWDVNSRDAEGLRSSSAVAANIINGCAGKPCPIVLQHDIKAFSVEAVEQVLIWGRDNGYSFKALDMSSPLVHHGIAN